MVDLNKEIKLSDLFKRGPKAGNETNASAETPVAATSRARAGFLKRDAKLPFGRGEKEPKPPAEAKPPKPRRARGARSAPPPPPVPLMRAFNLLPRDDARVAAGRRPSPPQLVLAVVALILLAALASAFLLLSARVSDKEQTYNSLREQLAALNVPQQEPATQTDPAEQALVEERKSRTSALATALAGRVAWDRLLREVSLVLPRDVWLINLTAKAPGGASGATATPPPSGATSGAASFLMSGYAYDQEDVAELLSRLSVIPELSAVQLVSSQRAPLGGREVVQFSISANVNPRGGAPA